MTLDLELLDQDSAEEALRAVADEARRNDIDWALIGGLAMALYGSDRNTKDIEIIANKPLPFEGAGRLRQGGERYIIRTGRKGVAVDWIIRKDEFKVLFDAALNESVKIGEVPVLTPEWLVILKFIAGRFKDQEDAVFLLSRKGLVDRRKIKEKIVEHVGAPAWGLARHGYQRWFDIADGRARDERLDHDDGYIDS